MEIALAAIFSLDEMRSVFGESFWNDNENTYLVPIQDVLPSEEEKLKALGINLDKHPTVKYLIGVEKK
jgi:hypothetical protein